MQAHVKIQGILVFLRNIVQGEKAAVKESLRAISRLGICWPKELHKVISSMKELTAAQKAGALMCYRWLPGTSCSE